MSARFADSFFYLALLNRDDEAHARAVSLLDDSPAMVTTAWVLTEVADALSDPGNRATFLDLLNILEGDAGVTIVPPSEALFQNGIRLYRDRPDKDWSLTDCISFAAMEEQGLTEALTGDHHFEQAGFRTLF